MRAVAARVHGEVHDLCLRAWDARREIGAVVGDAIGAASLMGLLVVLSFFGELLR